jgi:ribosomal-protein-alanine N-acetyltransferase
MTGTRLICVDDAPVITGLLIRNRDFLAPWEPARDDGHFTVEAQRKAIGAALERKARRRIAGVCLPSPQRMREDS